MSARPPDVVQIGPHPYALRFVPNVDATVHGADSDEGLFGHANHRVGELVIGLDMSPSQKRDTVLHEVLHAVLVQIAADDEKLVWGLAPLLLDTLQRNPQLVRYLTK